jgi:hypothetical protein
MLHSIAAFALLLYNLFIMAAESLYTGYFVTDIPRLCDALPPRQFENGTVYAHHVTREFQPADGIARVRLGHLGLVEAFGRVTTDTLDAVLVRPVDTADYPDFSVNTHPHITMSTASGVHPKESNTAIAVAAEHGTIEPIEPPIRIEVIEGYSVAGDPTVYTS